MTVSEVKLTMMVLPKVVPNRQQRRPDYILMKAEIFWARFLGQGNGQNTPDEAQWFERDRSQSKKHKFRESRQIARLVELLTGVPVTS